MDAAVEWPSIERRLHFGTLTDIRVDSDACVDDSCCLFWCQDTSSSTYFSSFPPRSFNVYGLWAAWPLLKSRIPGKIDMVPVRSK